jgi:hypothetical protein
MRGVMLMWVTAKRVIPACPGGIRSCLPPLFSLNIIRARDATLTTLRTLHPQLSQPTWADIATIHPPFYNHSLELMMGSLFYSKKINVTF